jgi:2-oxoglutarate dehydrogenase E1 component
MQDVDGVNAGYASLLLDEYLENPEAVPAEWRALFEAGDSTVIRELPGLARLIEHAEHDGANGQSAVAAPAPAPQPVPEQAVAAAIDAELLGGVAAAMALVKAHRMHGHLAARLDPLGSEPVGDPALDPLRLEPKLTPQLIHVPGHTLAEALPHLKDTYCGSIAYEIEHISDHEQRVWLRKAIESWRFRTPLVLEEKRRLYSRLCEVEEMERYLRRSFLARSSSRSRGSTCSSRCSTSRSRSPPARAYARS